MISQEITIKKKLCHEPLVTAPAPSRIITHKEGTPGLVLMAGSCWQADQHRMSVMTSQEALTESMSRYKIWVLVLRSDFFSCVFAPEIANAY